MEKKVLNAAAYEKKEYYFNEDFGKLPEDIKKKLKAITAVLAEKLHGMVTIGFYEDGTIFIEHSRLKEDIDFDEIGVKLEIDKLQREEHDLFYALTIWYKAVILGEIPIQEVQD